MSDQPIQSLRQGITEFYIHVRPVATYVEIVDKSVDPVFIQGVKNEISVERLHDNLIKLSYTIPGQGRKVTEYWFRVPSPDVKIMAD